MVFDTTPELIGIYAGLDLRSLDTIHSWTRAVAIQQLLTATAHDMHNHVADILKHHPPCADAADDDYVTALHIAAYNQSANTIALLLRYGAKVDALTIRLETPLMMAAQRGGRRFRLAERLKSIWTLYEAGADPNAEDSTGMTILSRAVDALLPQGTIQALILAGADCRHTSYYFPPLWSAIVNLQPKIALMLCAFGADPSTTNQAGSSLLAEARELTEQSIKFTVFPNFPSRKNEVINMLSKWSDRQRQGRMRKLLQEGELAPFIDGMGQFKTDELMWSAARRGEIVIEYLLDYSSIEDSCELLKQRDDKGWQAIHHAAVGGESRTADILLRFHSSVKGTSNAEHGPVDVNSVTASGWTPLLLAAQKGRPRTVRILLEHKADILASKSGRNAFDFVLTGKHARTLEVLEEFSSRIQDPKIRKLAMLKAANVRTSLENDLRDQETQDDNQTHPFISDIRLPVAQLKLQPQTRNKVQPNSKGTASGAFDGLLFSAPLKDSNLNQSRMFNELVNVEREYLDFRHRDKRVKIAVLDTGLDINHSDWSRARVLGFRQGKAFRDDKGPPQRDRIKAWKDFSISGPSENHVDLDGHGTQVTGLILRLAPTADIYIARVCEGHKSRGVPEAEQSELESGTSEQPQAEAVAKAIDWAVKNDVDLINMSFGFRFPQPVVREALKRARDKDIIVFAAMSNDGNNSPEGAAWPARDSRLTIGVHSCREGGRKTSDFTPTHVRNDDNFMVVGEGVITHWPEHKGGGFRADSGTSFATPVVTAMAAVILAFLRQVLFKADRAKALRLVDIDEVNEMDGMRKVLRHVSTPGENDKYSYIHPALLWKGFNPTGLDDTVLPQKLREYAWNNVREALDS